VLRSGAAAVAVVATLLGRVDAGRDLTLRLRGGTLILRVLLGAGGEVERVTVTGGPIGSSRASTTPTNLLCYRTSFAALGAEG